MLPVPRKRPSDSHPAAYFQDLNEQFFLLAQRERHGGNHPPASFAVILLFGWHPSQWLPWAKCAGNPMAITLQGV